LVWPKEKVTFGVARENPQKGNVWFGMVHKNQRIGIRITIWSTRREEVYFVMQKLMRQRSQPKKGKDFLAAMLIFCFEEVRVEFPIVNLLT
jgi:hypothetical protein